MRRLRVLGALVAGHHGIAPALHVGDRGQQQPEGLLGPAEAEEVDETQDVAAIGALSVGLGRRATQGSNSSATPAKKLSARARS